MSPLDQNYALAKALGVLRHDYEEGVSFEVPYKQCRVCCMCEDEDPHNECPLIDIPDYCDDLDLVHQAESILVQAAQYARWYEALHEVVQPTSSLKGSNGYAHVTFQLCHATAAQRTEALLRTLNLWTCE